MKRSCLVPRSFVQRSVLTLAAAAFIGVVSLGHGALSVGVGGLPVQTFNTLPPVSDWSTLSVGTAAGTYTDAAALDAAVIANTSASAVNVALTGNGTQPPGQNATPRWNSAGLYLQTRPTGNDYQILMATLQNDSGMNISSIVVSYDWAQRNAVPVNESVPGHRAYYSISGAPGSWTLIPEFSNFSNNDTTFNLVATLNLGSWPNGSALYIIWVDDNGPGGTSNPMEGAYSIDNFAIALPGVPPSISTQPAGQTNAEYSVVTLSVGAIGAPPLTYQWFKNGNPVTGGTNSTLAVTNTAGSGKTWSVPGDSGDYTVTITGSTPPAATSSAAHVVIRPDTNAPTITRVVGQIDPTLVKVTFSEPIDPSTIDALNFTLYDRGGSAATSPYETTLATLVDPTNILITTTPRVFGSNYAVEVIGIRDASANQATLATTNVNVRSTVQLIGFDTDNIWKYDINNGDRFGTGWELPPYDDSTWPEGPAGLGKDASVNGVPIRTELPYNADSVTTFFRRHFDLPADPATVTLTLRDVVEDGAVYFLNGQDTYRHNVAAGALTFATRAAAGQVDPTPIQGPFSFPTTNLVQGDNVMAVAVLQSGATSSDVELAVELTAEFETFASGPPVITTQPVGETVPEGSVARLSVTANGGGTLHYQWFRNNTAIPGPRGTAAILVVTNIAGSSPWPWSVPSDSGSYHVVITGAVNPPATSQTVQVNVLADTNAPRFLWAIAETNATGGTTIHLRLSEVVGNPLSDYSEVLNWVVNKTSGPGGSLDAPDSVLITNQDIYLEYAAAAVDPGTSYQVEYSGAPFYDRAQTPNTQAQSTVGVLAHEAELVSETAVWKYDDADLDPGAAWATVGYDDSNAAIWRSGPGPFDGKRGGNGAAGPDCRDIDLYNLGTAGTCIRLTSPVTATNTITYYFRTHFNFSGTDTTNVALLLNGKLDDGGIVYLNGTELQRIRMPAGPVTKDTFANGTVGDTDPQDIAMFFAPASLHTGDNVIAVEVHQVNLTSSDVTMGLRVAASTITPAATGGTGPTMNISRNATTGAITITWTGTGTLQQSSEVGAAASWGDVTGAGANSYTFTPGAGAPHLFFRVRP